MAGDGVPGVIKVAVIDDDPSAGSKMIEVLSGTEHCDVVAAARSVSQFLSDCPESVNVVVLDALLRSDPAIVDNVRRVRETGAEVLLVSCYFEEHEILQVLRAGASGFLPKSAGYQELPDAVRSVAAGRFVASREAMLSVLNDRSSTRPILTQRELQVAALYASGMFMKNIARRLDISTETVKTHIDHVREKYREVGDEVGDKISLRSALMRDGVLDDRPAIS